MDSKTWIPERRYKLDHHPEWSSGKCTVESCEAIGDLADGLCMKHWDMGE